MGTELPSNVQARCYTDMSACVHMQAFADCDNQRCQRPWNRSYGSRIRHCPRSNLLHSKSHFRRGSLGDIVTAVEWMIDHEGVDVINMSLSFSWSGPGDGTTRHSRIRRAEKRSTRRRCWSDIRVGQRCRKFGHRTLGSVTLRMRTEMNLLEFSDN